jgi:predicted glycoside hydrolase/deacetylase ChbG (UPF0249 family)
MDLIINADDLGYNKIINKAILHSFKEGLCSSVSIMPNMPGFSEACHLIHENKLITRVGLHLVLSEGFPLTDKIKNYSIFCNNKGQFCFSQKKPTVYLKNNEKRALTTEIIAQIKRCRDYNIPITHVDSHQHVHNQWGIATVLIPIVHKYKIPFIRISRNCGPNLNFTKRIYKKIYNHKLRRQNLARTQFLGNIEDFILLTRHQGKTKNIKSFELVVHPNYNKENVLIDSSVNKYLKDVVKIIDRYQNAISYIRS